MEKLLSKYINKLCSQGLTSKDNISFLGLDDILFSNKPLKDELLELSKLFQLMNINSILFAQPSEPYKSIIKALIKNDFSAHAVPRTYNSSIKCGTYNVKDDYGLTKKIAPKDCETRTFLHDIPVVDNFSAELLAKALSERKSAIVKDMGIISYGTVTPEQAFVSYSSTCFAVYVKYFADALNYFEYCIFNKIAPDVTYLETFATIADYIKRNNPHHTFDLSSFSFSSLDISKKPMNEGDVIQILSETGRIIVNLHLVDSYFGNISYVFGDNIFISQTGASMDELESSIDKVPLNGSATTGITSSSELPTHLRIYRHTGRKAILHAHPRFSVIMSMYCPFSDCLYFRNRQMCHTSCTERRYIHRIPVVSGEIGTGQTSIVNTVPAAIGETGGVIVYGHGVFTLGREDFGEALSLLVEIENNCFTAYFEKISEYISLC